MISLLQTREYHDSRSDPKESPKDLNKEMVGMLARLILIAIFLSTAPCHVWAKTVDQLSKGGENWIEIGRNANNHEDKIRYFTKAIEENPNQPFGYILRGISYGVLKSYELAFEDMDAAIRIAPDTALALTLRGSLYSVQGKHDLAFIDYNRSIELVPDSVLVYGLRCETYRMIEEYELALNDCNRSVEILPNTANHLGRGIVYLRLQNYDRALEDYNKSLEFDGQNVETRLVIAELNFIQGDYVKASENSMLAYEIAVDDEIRLVSTYLMLVSRIALNQEIVDAEDIFTDLASRGINMVDWRNDLVEKAIDSADLLTGQKDKMKKITQIFKKHLEYQ